MNKNNRRDFIKGASLFTAAAFSVSGTTSGAESPQTRMTAAGTSANSGAAPSLGVWEHGRFSMTVLNLPKVGGGAGLSVVMRAPDGRTFVYDTGNGYDFPGTPGFETAPNNGRDVVIPFLKARGIREIDGLVISHAHADHFGGFMWMADHFPIKNLWDPGYTLPGRRPDDYSGELGCYAKLRDDYRRRFPDAYRAVHAGDRLDWGEGLEVEVLSPPADFFAALPSATRPKNDGPDHHLINANAIALRIRHGKVSFFIVGDIQEDYLKERLWPMLPPEKKKCDVCVLPSHGIHSIKEEAEATRPSVAIGSVWLPWARSVPAWRVYGAVGATVYVTGVNGDIETVSDGVRFTTTAWRTFEAQVG